MRTRFGWWSVILLAGMAYTPAIPAEGVPGFPSAGTLLYSRLTEGTWQIWKSDLATGRTSQVTFTPGDKRRPAFVGPGVVGYCTTNQACFVTDGDRSSDRQLVPDLSPVREVAWSPDSRLMVFSKFRADLKDSANLWMADSDGTNRRMLTHEPGVQQHPAWSPDGRWIAYSGGQGWGTYEIYVVRADGTERRRLTVNQTHDFLPAWSPDGTQLVFSSDRSGDYEIWTMALDGSGARQLTTSQGLDTHPTWSPDGSHVAFVTNRAGRLELWVMEPDGVNQRPLAVDGEGVCDPAWR